jgi:glucose-1-phosphate cytidylyltransferase
MVEIGGRPILWHIMSHYSRFGYSDFVLCLGYRGDVIRNYFIDFRSMNADVRIHISDQRIEYLKPLTAEVGWTVTLVETGVDTPTAGRLMIASKYFLGEPFFCTYGDGLSNVDIRQLLERHRAQGTLATVTGVRPRARFGRIDVRDGHALAFREKPLEEGWINGGFFVFEPGVLAYLREDLALEGQPLERLAAEAQLSVYEHDGYWAAMDTYREFVALNEEWASGRPGWLDRA